MAKTTTIEESLAALGPGETLVVLFEEGGGYILGVGDKYANNTFAITPAELQQIVRLGARHLNWAVGERAGE